jgi:hypothetical protein
MYFLKRKTVLLTSTVASLSSSTNLIIAYLSDGVPVINVSISFPVMTLSVHEEDRPAEKVLERNPYQS